MIMKFDMQFIKQGTLALKHTLVIILTLCMTAMSCAMSLVKVKANEEETMIDEHVTSLFDQSYESLVKRITGRGYAPTSLTGAYSGMFIRDSSIQIMAQTEYGDYEQSRRMLQYLLSYQKGYQAEYAAHILPDFQDEYYDNHYLHKKEGATDPLPPKGYDEQTDTSLGLYLINAPEHAAGTAFVPTTNSFDTISAFLTKSTAEDQVVASIRTNISDEKSTIATATYTFGKHENGWQNITFDAPVHVTKGQTYYLVLQAAAQSGSVVWYGTSQGQEHFLPGYNYDLPTFHGWIEQAQYPAFRIGEHQVEQSDFVQQDNASMALYRINGPGNQAAQAFVPEFDEISEVAAYLTKTHDQDTVHVSIRKNYKDPATTVGELRYTFDEHESGWQRMVFETPIKVEPNETYYLVLQASEDSGAVIWMGTNAVEKNTKPAYNYDATTLEGWLEQPAFCTAFAIQPSVAIQGTHAAAKAFTVAGDIIEQIQVDVTSLAAEGNLVAELREAYDDPHSSIATGQTTINKKGNHTYTIAFDQPVPVSEGTTYYLVLQSKDSTKRVNWNARNMKKSDAYLYNGKWKQTSHDLSLSILPEWSGSYKIPFIKLGEDQFASQQIPSQSEVVSAVQVLLGKTSGAKGQIKASLYKNHQVIDTRFCDVETLTEHGDWVTFPFALPLTGLPKEGDYEIRIEAPGAKQDSIIWYGTHNIDQYETIKGDTQGSEVISGEASFNAAKSIISPISNAIQVDGNYMLIHAWALYVYAAPHTDENKRFIADSYPIIARFANYFLDQGYLDPTLNLLRNDNLEHSREGRYWNSYDAITNAFGAQALHEMSEIAKQQNDNENANKWKQAADTISEGLNTSMTTELDGKLMYAELYDVSHDMKLIKGLSWVNWGPMAAQWYGMDPVIMQNTYDVYKKYASQDYDGYQMLDVCYDLDSKGYGNHIIGKGFAWELMYNDLIQDSTRVSELVNFVLSHSTEEGVYPETWQPGGNFSDIGNQEHCSWQVYAMSKVFPALTKTGASKDVHAWIEKVENITETEYTTDSYKVLQSGLANALEVTKDPQATKQSFVAAQDRLQSAYEQLKHRADTTEVVKEIAKAETLDPAKYTKDSWHVYDLALQGAKAILENYANITQETADSVLANLQAARQALREDTVFIKEILHNAIFKADRIVQSKDFQFLAPLIQQLIKLRLQDANIVYEQASSTIAQCSEAWFQLANAMQFADFKADKRALADLLVICNAIDVSSYEIGVTEFKAALAQGRDVYDNPNALQERIEACYQRLLAAKEGLKEIGESVIKSALTFMVEKVEEAVKHKQDYLQNKAWESMISALAEAKTILAQEGVKQAIIDTAAQKLAKAYEDIRLLPNEAMLKQLESFINIVDKLDRARYSEEHLAGITKAYKQVKAMLHQQTFTAVEFMNVAEEIATIMNIIQYEKLPLINHQDTSKQDTSTAPSSHPNTGDTTNVISYLFMVSLAGIIGLGVVKRCKFK